MRKRLINKDATIISNNCTGGVISHDLGMRFYSPTINLYMNARDFVKFCENLEFYLNIREIRKIEDNTRKYPVGMLHDITLYFVHYNSFDEACEKWFKRAKRVNLNNIRIFGCDRDGMTKELMKRFDLLPYPKVLFTHLPVEGENNVYIKGYEEDGEVGFVLDRIGWRGKRVIDQFDYVTFINEGRHD